MKQISLTNYGLIALNGENTVTFLQGQLTCDVKLINETTSSLGCYCDHKGRILASFRLFLINNIYYLLLPKSILENTLTELKKFAAFSQVNVRDASEDYHVIGLVGKNLLNKPHDVYHENGHIYICLDDNENRYFLLQKNPPNEPDTITLNDWIKYNIKQGIAEISSETIGLFTPHIINYPELGAVSFNKGCYRGQEIVARMQYLGKLKQHACRAEINTPEMLKPGMSIQDANKKSVGELISFAKLNENHYIMLLTLMDAARISQQVFINHQPLVNVECLSQN
ncbi:MAG: folate-binding protein YgfZ [Gammaproteobacteria bacterium]